MTLCCSFKKLKDQKPNLTKKKNLFSFGSIKLHFGHKVSSYVLFGPYYFSILCFNHKILFSHTLVLG